MKEPAAPDITYELAMRLTRKEVMDEMGPLLSRIRAKWTKELAKDIAATLTPQKLKVMTPEAKALLAIWVYQQEDTKYVKWLNDAAADISNLDYTATGKYERPSIVECLTRTTIFMRDLDQAANAFVPRQRDFFQTRLNVIRKFIKCLAWHLDQQSESETTDSSQESPQSIVKNITQDSQKVENPRKRIRIAVCTPRQ